MGDPIAPWDGAIVQQLMPKAVSTPNTYSGIFGLGRFPFHTDLAHWQAPPRYLLLRCVKGYADVPTLLLDGIALMAEVGAETMGRALVKPRRPQAGEVRLLRLRERGVEAAIIRWDQVYLMPASRIGEDASERVLDGAISGGATLNGTLMHVAQEHLPFGGVGASGIGACHGREGFKRFSHARAVHRIGFLNVF